jgi:GTPase SAR1 family protein
MCNGPNEATKLEQENRKLAAQQSKELDKKFQMENTAESQIHKLLLLGAGESGKSTLFKQMIQIYGTGFPEHERKTYIPIIHNNIILSMKTLVHHAPLLGYEVQCQAKNRFEELKGDEEIDSAMAEEIKALWSDGGIQKTYADRSKFQLTDSAHYFFGKIDQIGQSGYIPSEQDVLRSRVRTTGIVENCFDIAGNQFKMFDVGGQRNERKKWIHCFEEVTAVLFVAAISEYDQVLYEDENMNRMEEALNLFDDISNSKWFKDTAMILFLNKRDLFREKIKVVSLRTCFPEYDGDDSYEDGTAFIQSQFESKARNPTKAIYSHITCATDTNNVNAVFDAVKDIIIQAGLTEAGLV